MGFTVVRTRGDLFGGLLRGGLLLHLRPEPLPERFRVRERLVADCVGGPHDDLLAGLDQGREERRQKGCERSDFHSSLQLRRRRASTLAPVEACVKTHALDGAEAAS